MTDAKAVMVAVVAPGAMGSATAARLVEHGAVVPTLLEGRSAATTARALAAGMQGVDEAGLMEAEIILSILPPGDAMGLAERLAPALRNARRKPVFVDCNALDVRTVQAVGAAIGATGARFVDGSIVGWPPKPGSAGPSYYLAGAAAGEVGVVLAGLGLQVRVMAGAVGAASALKMSYAGITKGLSALAAIMILGAERAGAGADLRSELAASQPQLLARFSTSLPDMVPKAYRWVAEMREIAAFLEGDAAGAAVFEGVAGLYERIAADAAGARVEVEALEAFFR